MPTPHSDAHDPDPDHAIDTHETARLIGLSEITLVQMRQRGAGPPYFRAGRTIRYVRRDVITWRDARKVGGGR